MLNSLQACQAMIASQFENIKLKLAYTNCHLKFNKSCLTHQLLPKYVQVKIKNTSFAAKKAKLAAEKIWVKNEIKFLYRKKSMLNNLLYKKQLEFANTSHPLEYENKLRIIESRVGKKVFRKKRDQDKKLTGLMNEQKHREDILTFDFEFYPRLVNQTKIHFNVDEHNLLNKGLKYNFSKNSKKGIFEELIAAESIIKFVPYNDERNCLRAIVNKKIKSMQNKVLSKSRLIGNINEQKVLNNIKQKLSENNAMISKADKGNSIVILYKDVYISKVEHFISNNNINEIGKDPTVKYSSVINKAINMSKNLFTADEMRWLKMINPSAPTLKGLPKIHKKEIPIRPLVNFMSAPAYRVAKKLDKLLRLHYVFNESHSIKNSLELVDKTKLLEIKDHHTLASFDVVNLYTNVPIKVTLEILEKNLKTQNTLNTDSRKELMHLLRLTLEQNYFTFEGKFYFQPDGLAMGSPLSGILSEIYLNHIENEYILSDKNPHSSKILHYSRYVDDTLVIFKGNARQLGLLNKFMNNLAPKLKFTLETETNSSINFLDLTIEKCNKKLKYKIYRKPTTTDQTIHASSYHPHSHKIAAYNSMVSRLIKIPMHPDDYITEVNIIKHIARSNGYNTNIIDKLIRKHLNNNTNDKRLTDAQVSNLPQIKYAPIEYGHRLYNLLKKELKPYNIVPAPKTSNKVERLLKPKSHHQTDILQKSGVYKLNCECGNYYIGQTGRTFLKRIREHKPNPRVSVQKSTFAQHAIDNDHPVVDIKNKVEILEIGNKGFVLDTLEEFHIYKAIKNDNDLVLNEKLNYSSHLIFNKILESQTKRTSSSSPGETPDRTSPLITPPRSAHCNPSDQCPPAGIRDARGQGLT